MYTFNVYFVFSSMVIRYDTFEYDGAIIMRRPKFWKNVLELSVLTDFGLKRIIQHDYERNPLFGMKLSMLKTNQKFDF